ATDPVNAILLRGDGITISGAAGVTLTLASGTLAANGGTASGNIVTVPTLALGSQEGMFLSGTGTTTVSSTITGSGGLSVAGGGNLILTGTNSYTGATTLDSGTVTVGALGALSSGALQ